MNNWKYLSFVVFCLMMFSIGCVKGAPKPRMFTENITVSPGANPDHEGRPSPIVVWVYQLRSVSKFQKSDFFSLYDNGTTVLENDLINISEKELSPGMRYNYDTKIDPEAQFIAVVAAFRDIEKARWRVVIDVPKKRFFFSKKILQVNVDKLSVSAAFIK